MLTPADTVLANSAHEEWLERSFGILRQQVSAERKFLCCNAQIYPRGRVCQRLSFVLRGSGKGGPLVAPPSTDVDGTRNLNEHDQSR